MYYRALRLERARLDRYVAALNVASATYDKWSREQKIALWLNAYNAFVLQTVINRFPIVGRSKAYPANSIRQIPGAFDEKRHRAAGKLVSLDDIEKGLAEFRDPRLYFALGRGAEGSGRLRSEAYTADRLEEQLATQTQDFLTRQNHLQIDRPSNQVSVTPIISWHEAEFAAAYAGGSPFPRTPRPGAPSRRPCSRSSCRWLLPTEREFLEQNQFKLTWQEFNWSLNDLASEIAFPHSAMDLELSNKVAVVTGSSRGLGLASARALVEEGCRVAICARGADALDAAARDLSEAGGTTLKPRPVLASRPTSPRSRASRPSSRKPSRPSAESTFWSTMSDAPAEPTSSRRPMPSGKRRSTRRSSRRCARRGSRCRTCGPAAAA